MSKNHKPHLLILTPSFPPQLGGVETHLRETCRLLLQKGYCLTVVTEEKGKKAEVENFGRSEEVVKVADCQILSHPNLNIYRFNFPKIKFLGLLAIWWQLWRLWRRYGWGGASGVADRLAADQSASAEQAEVAGNGPVNLIHIHDVFIWYLPFALLAKIGLWPRKTIITTMHGWEGIYPIPVKNIFYKRLAAWLSDKVVCVGRYIEKYYGVKADAVIEGGVAGGVAGDAASGATGDAVGGVASRGVGKQSKKQPVEKKRQIVFLGRLAADNGLEIYLQAIRQLRAAGERFSIDFYGDGPLAPQCRQLGTVHGFVSAAETRQQLRQASICLVGGYLSIIESLRSGCLPIAAYQHPLRKDYLQLSSAKDYLKISSSPEEISKIILDFWQRSARYQRQIKEGQRWAKKQTWEKVVAKYQQFMTSFDCVS